MLVWLLPNTSTIITHDDDDDNGDDPHHDDDHYDHDRDDHDDYYHDTWAGKVKERENSLWHDNPGDVDQ